MYKGNGSDSPCREVKIAVPVFGELESSGVLGMEMQ